MEKLQSRYKNKYFSVLGDSISTLEGFSEPKGAEYYKLGNVYYWSVRQYSETWWGQVIEALGGELLVNNSWSGSTVCWLPGYEIPSYASSAERTSSLGADGITPDVIMVFMGVNDWGVGVQVSSDRCYHIDEERCSLFSVAYEKMLEKLKKNYPNAEIWCLTLPISKCTVKQGFEFPYHYAGRHIFEYCEAIKAAAEKYNCRLIDLNLRGEPHDTIDGFHPNVMGMQTLSKTILGELTKQGE